MTTGVLLMAHGTPGSRADIGRFYTDIRHGRPPSEHQLADLERRYTVIGGLSPLRERTEVQALELANLLGDKFVVRLGMKHASPTIEEAALALLRSGVERVVALVMAPHYSTASVGQYLDRAAAALGSTPLLGIESWHDHPGLHDLLASRLQEALTTSGTDPTVVFTAHSLPTSVPDSGEYSERLAATAAAVASRVGIPAGRWTVGWQSAGRTPGPWLGPDIGELIDQAARRRGGHVVVCPAGFVTDHLETLFDLDIRAAARAWSLDIGFSRTRALDTDVCEVLADLVLSTEAASVSRLTA